MNPALRPRRQSALFLPLTLILAAAPLSAQDIDTPVFRSSTRLVELNLVILDKDNHPVSGLGLGDFRVYDNGIEQKIVHFSPSRNLHLPSPVQQSPLILTNRLGDDDQPQGITAILVDEFILDQPQVVPAELTAPIRSARLAVISYLAALPPGTQVALYAMRRDGVVVIHDFTSDSAALVAAAKSLGGGGPRGQSVMLNGLLTDGERALGGWTGNGRSASRHSQPPSDNFDSLLSAGFKAIVQHLEAVPGRKNLVWISSTLPTSVMDLDLESMLGGAGANITPIPTLANPAPVPHHPSPQNQYQQLREFAHWLANANIAVYPLDANGLTVGGSSQGQWSAADLIATETGGRAIFDSNAFDQHLREISAESGSFYQIGYYPGDTAWDGKYHKIRVKLSPAYKGLNVRCRRGYIAADQPVTQNSDGALLQAARSVVESPAIGVTLKLPSNPLRFGPQNVLLKVDLHDVQFDFTGDHPRAALDIAFVQLGKDGRIVDQFKDRISLGYPQQAYLDAVVKGWYYPKSIPVVPQAEKVRVVVRDLATGAVGSVSVPVAFKKTN